MIVSAIASPGVHVAIAQSQREIPSIQFNQTMTTQKTLMGLGAWAVSLALVGTNAFAGSPEIVGVEKLTLSEGANSLAVPLQGAAVFKGRVASVSGSEVLLSNTATLVASAYAPATSGSVALYQYVLMLRDDASASPGNEGDWYPITGNTTGSVTVDAGGDVLSTLFAVGDEIEIRKLRTLGDIFGAGASCILQKDADLDETSGNDLIRFLLGTSFSTTVFYHDGSQIDEGYYVDGEFFGDGATVTVLPDEPVIVFRESGAGISVRASTGRVQGFRLTHYLNAGATTVASAFPVSSPIGTSGLKEAGFIQDNDLDETVGNDLLRQLVGTSFLESVFYHDGTIDAAGWYVDGTINNTWPLPPGEGLVLFTAGSLKWRQEVPYRN